MIGEKIKSLVNQGVYSVTELAKMMDYKNRQSIYHLYGLEDVDTSVLKRLSKIYSVPITYFFEESDENVSSRGNYGGSELDNLRKKVSILESEKHELQLSLITLATYKKNNNRVRF